MARCQQQFRAVIELRIVAACWQRLLRFDDRAGKMTPLPKNLISYIGWPSGSRDFQWRKK
jgi:hypothetical protein